MPGNRRIDACIDHFALMGYDASTVRAVAADLLKVYGGGPDAWKFLEEGRYQVVQDRLLEIEDEEKEMQKPGQELQPECHQQQDGQQFVQDVLLEIEDKEKLKQDQQLQPDCPQQQDGQQTTCSQHASSVGRSGTSYSHASASTSCAPCRTPDLSTGGYSPVDWWHKTLDGRSTLLSCWCLGLSGRNATGALLTAQALE